MASQIKVKNRNKKTGGIRGSENCHNRRGGRGRLSRKLGKQEV